LFFVEAYRTDGDQRWREPVRGAASWMAHHLDTSAAGWAGCGLFTGIGGWTVALDEFAFASGDDEVRHHAATVVRAIMDRAAEADEGTQWHELTEILWGKRCIKISMKGPLASAFTAFVGLVVLLVSPQAAAAGQGNHIVDPRQGALLKLELAHQNSSGMLLHGCVSLAGDRVCLPRVTVDGHRLADLAVLTGDVVEASKHSRRLPLRSPTATRAGVAWAVFNYLVDVAAARDHIRVTTKQGRALAERELKFFESSPPPPGTIGPVPPGMTARQYFLSPRTIEGYRHGIVVSKERERIFRRYPGLKETRAFQRWLGSQVPRHLIRINGSKLDYSIADAYSP